MVLNYIGPEHGQGFRIYNDGVKLVGGSTTSSPSGTNFTPLDGSVALGKFRNEYSSVAINELLFFNNKLTDAQIRELYDEGYTKKTKVISKNYGKK